METTFLTIIRRLFGVIDGIVAWAIETIYNLLIAIADTNVLGDLVYHYLGRIYMFLSVFMIFKLSISIINYIVNPDALTDKSKGFGKIITNVVISLVLLAVTPNIFDAAFNLQTDLLKSNAVYQLVTGKELKESSFSKQGEKLAYAVFSSFVYGYDGNKNIVALCEYNQTVKCLLNKEIITAKTGSFLGIGGEFDNEYHIILSTITGAFVAYMLLTFCFQAAVRAIKLSVLQIIAPVPILSMIDPKDGNKKFTNWAKESGKTFIDLFIRLAVLFFALDIITNVISGSIDNIMTSYSSGTKVTDIWVRLFIIIGCLMFTKQFPQLLNDVLGVNLSGGGFSLKKTLGDLPGAGLAKAAGAGALGFAGGMAANAWATKNNWKGQGFKGGLRNVGSILAGGMSGAGRGLTSKEKNMFKAAGAGISGAVGARNLRADRKATGDSGIKGWASRRVGDMDKFAGVSNDDTAKIKAQRDLGDKLYKEVNGYTDDNGKKIGPKYGSKYDIVGTDEKFKKAWENSDKAKNYRNDINSQLSMARSDFQAGKEISWNGKTGSAAIAALEVESAKATAAYDKASADFKELRSMQTHKTSTTNYEAYNAEDDRRSAAEFAHKSVSEYSAIDRPTTLSPSTASSQSRPAPTDIHAKDDTYYNDMGM